MMSLQFADNHVQSQQYGGARGTTSALRGTIDIRSNHRNVDLEVDLDRERVISEGKMSGARIV